MDMEPSTPLAVPEIQVMIQRLRRAMVIASVNDDPRWAILAEVVHALQNLHRLETGAQF